MANEKKDKRHKSAKNVDNKVGEGSQVQTKSKTAAQSSAASEMTDTTAPEPPVMACTSGSTHTLAHVRRRTRPMVTEQSQLPLYKFVSNAPMEELFEEEEVVYDEEAYEEPYADEQYVDETEYFDEEEHVLSDSEPEEQVQVQAPIAIQEVALEAGVDLEFLQKHVVTVAEAGPPINSALAKTCDNIWLKARSAQEVKELQALKPGNISNIRKMDMNEEVIHNLNRFTRSRDIRMRSVQGTFVHAAYPVITLMSDAMNRDRELNRQEIVDAGMTAVKLLAHGNRNLNSMRRELLKSQVAPKFQRMCNGENVEANASGLLFGNDVAKQMKDIDESVRLGQKMKQRTERPQQRFQPYPAQQAQRQPQYANQNAYPNNTYTNYGNTQPARGQSQRRTRGAFLGQYRTLAETIVSNEFDIPNEFHVFNPSPQVDHHTNLACLLQDQGVENSMNNDYNDYALCYRQKPAVKKTGAEKGKLVNYTIPKSKVGEYPRYFITFMDNCMHNIFQAGNISLNWSEWKKITNDWTILKLVQGMNILFTDTPISQGNSSNSMLKISHTERPILEAEIKGLEGKGVIERTAHSEGEFISQIFMRGKKGYREV